MNSVRVLGIDFFAGPVEEAVDIALGGGVVVGPSAPVLVLASREPLLQAALERADLAIPDSALMVLHSRLRGHRSFPRVSGLRYLAHLIRRDAMRRAGATFWVMPTQAAAGRTLRWLRGQGTDVCEDDFYVAPMYRAENLRDAELLARLKDRRPQHAILCVGGGIQERLADGLREDLDWKIGLHCTGAAIAFLTGDQIRIPMWADAIYLGWLFRCLSDRGRSLRRYLPSLELIRLIGRHGAASPFAA
jgi:UDP-N-acetyl-D-mannosaminuronic acid transferase (WecB/TagA/CpsF family)